MDATSQPSPLTAIGRVVREEGARMLATVIRACGGDFDLAEEALQDATTKAIEAWADGVPELSLIHISEPTRPY